MFQVTKRTAVFSALHYGGGGWINAKDLTPNDTVYTKDWNTATVKSVNLLELDEPVEVYNFEVEDCHTYFVGDFCILVHNADCTEAAKKGVHKHKDWEYGQNNKTIFKEYDFKAKHGIEGVGRANAVDLGNRIVYELKPNNARAIRQGWKQLNRYTAALEEAFPGTEWIKILITY